MNHKIFHSIIVFLIMKMIFPGILASDLDSMSVPEKKYWNSQILELAKIIPIQDEGRIKPLDTYARFTLLKLNGRRNCYNSSGTKISAIEWLFDCIFSPKEAMKYEVFLIENSSVIDALNISHVNKKKRDRYSYVELFPGREKLFSFAREFSRIDEKKRDSTQAQLVNLAQNFVDFEWLIYFLDFAREEFLDSNTQDLSPIFDEHSRLRFSDILLQSKELREFYLSEVKETPDQTSQDNPKIHALTQLLERIDTIGMRSDSMAIFPPNSLDPGNTSWLTPADIMNSVLAGQKDFKNHIALIRAMEDLVGLQNSPEQFEIKLQEFQSTIKRMADERGEYGKIPLEVMFYKGNFFSYGLVFFIFSFVILSISWIKPRSRGLIYGARITVLCGGLSLIIGIVFRCIIRSRPPVSTLYESVLFITAVSVIIALIIEYFDRQNIAIVIGATLGALGLFLANKYEIKEGSDTMTSLVAVLDSNYWLSTHVTTVTIGYAAGLLASAIAHVYILGKIFKLNGLNPVFYRTLSKMVYGVICFGLFFSIVGTILGGIWANDSWGRFWGWDPKENGALMIILWELTILHARLGGYIRELGLCVSAIIVGCIVSFSWWGVNLLGVGLHSYGWTSGVYNSLVAFYFFESIILLLSAFIWYRNISDSKFRAQVLG